MIKVAALIVSHNNPKLTDGLVESIKRQTLGVEVDVYVIETGSDKDKCSKYTNIWVDEGIRMTRGWNTLKDYADRNGDYFAYQLFVNDAKLLEGQDMISYLAGSLSSDEKLAYIHPYQTTPYPQCPQVNKVNKRGIRYESFAEIVCPMIRKDLWDKVDMLDRRFFYGWGLDYDHTKLVHDAGYRMAISDDVGIEHVPYTSYRDGADKNLNQDKFLKLAQENMIQGLVEKYGKNWKQVIRDSIPEEVGTKAFDNWSS